MRRLLALAALGSLGCSEELIEPGRMWLTSGHEPDPWSASPAPVRALVQKESAAGELRELASPTPPVTGFSLGRGGAGRFVVTGFDAADVPRVRARSLLLEPAGFAGGSLPLFVSRTGSFARPPGELPSELGTAPVATVVAARHLLLARGSAAGLALDGYDLAAWQPVEPPPALDCGAASCEPRSLGVVQGSLVLAVGDGWGFWFDPIVGDSGKVDPPDGLSSFAEVAGGAAVPAPDGSVFIVGGTRAGAPSASVLVIAADGALSHLALASPRKGAAATWVEGRGLVVVGGGDASAAGAELLADGAKAFTPLPQPPDPTEGAAIVALDSSRLLRLGGRLSGGPAPSVELSLGCAASCQPKPAGDALALSPAWAFPRASGVLVVGSDEAGETRVLRFEGGKAAGVELREPRSGATPALLPTGHVGLAGGVLAGGGAARTLELYVD